MCVNTTCFKTNIFYLTWITFQVVSNRICRVVIQEDPQAILWCRPAFRALMQRGVGKLLGLHPPGFYQLCGACLEDCLLSLKRLVMVKKTLYHFPTENLLTRLAPRPDRPVFFSNTYSPHFVLMATLDIQWVLNYPEP